MYIPAHNVPPRLGTGLWGCAELKLRFDGRIAVELRLWDALDRGLLSPFQYFGLHTGPICRASSSPRRGYDVLALETVWAPASRVLLRSFARWRMDGVMREAIRRASGSLSLRDAALELEDLYETAGWTSEAGLLTAAEGPNEGSDCARDPAASAPRRS